VARAAKKESLPLPPLKLPSYAAPQCKNFISDSGELGPWGEKFLQAIRAVDNKYQEQKNSSCFQNDAKVGVLCPGFRKLRTPEKEAFWVHTAACIAHFESSCRPTASARGSYDKAIGLFQLEFTTRRRAISERDPVFCQTKSKSTNVTTNIDFQTQCTASIIADVHCKRGHPLGGRVGYWEELNHSSGKITRCARRFPKC
jgi:hypothetical protein